MFEISNVHEALTDSEDLERLLHQTIKKVTRDLESLRLNVAVSQLMIFVNEANAQGGVSIDTLSRFIRLLAPFAPHISEELWQALGNKEFVLNAPWPDLTQTKVLKRKLPLQCRSMASCVHVSLAEVVRTKTQSKLLHLPIAQFVGILRIGR